MHIVVFSGAGISAESGLKTFRDSDGLWEQYNVMDVATPEAWNKDREMVLEFYNARRKQVIEANPNSAHLALAGLETHFQVSIITQNIDDLHERAGSSSVLHLHGEVMKGRSSLDPQLLYPVKDGVITLGERCEKGSQLRPHVVWFGEAVPEMENAYQVTSEADIFIVVGSSLNVYPAAGLVQFAPAGIPLYIIDPQEVPIPENAQHIRTTAGEGVPQLVERLKREFG